MQSSTQRFILCPVGAAKGYNPNKSLASADLARYKQDSKAAPVVTIIKDGVKSVNP